MIKGKVKLCETPVGAFNIEIVSGAPFYERYNEFARVFISHGVSDFEQLFAEPSFNAATKRIEWFIPMPDGEMPIKFSQLADDEERAQYQAALASTIERLKATQSAVKQHIDSVYFACALRYIDSVGDFIYCHNGMVTFALWGMGLRGGHELNTVITDVITDHRIHRVTFRIEGEGSLQGRQELHRRHNHRLDSTEIPSVKAAERYNFVKWLPNNPQGHSVTDDIEFTAVCRHSGKYLITFDAGNGGTLNGNMSIELNGGTKLFETALPVPTPAEGFEFVGWEPTIDATTVVSDDCNYTAIFRERQIVPPALPPEPHVVRFNAGEGGALPAGYTDVTIPDGSIIPQEWIPAITAAKGSRFVGWDKRLDQPITADTTFNAVYEPVAAPVPWYKGCLKWLIWLLVALLLLAGLSLLLTRCAGVPSLLPGCSRVADLPQLTLPDGTVIDDNGAAVPVADSLGRLPDGVDRITAPVRGEDGEMPPIVSSPGVPDVIGNRLFLFLEDDNGDVDALAAAFKKAYPGDQYNIIGFDREAKLLVIQIPENEREQIKQSINSRIPDQRFFVFDEEVYEIKHSANFNDNAVDAGWHLDAIHLKQGWSITQGSPDIKVAIVDDGIDAGHDMFKGRISQAYNVFTRDNKLSAGVGHGTHTAALAAGSSDFYDKGAAGVAPKSAIIPVQVFDNKQCPLSALVAGIMYAVHNDADVINVSIGPKFEGLNILPVREQKVIADTQFKNVAMLWSRVTSIAARKNSILVFAAGNDDIISSIPPENRNNSSIVVTSVDKRLYPTDFTNYGPCSDISAPGTNIYSAFPTNDFRSCDGTSMSAPIVAGTVALMKSIKRDLTVEQARTALYNSGADVYGYIPPMVLVDKALEAVKKGDFTRRERDYRPVPDADLPGLNSGGGSIIVSPGASGDTIVESDGTVTVITPVDDTPPTLVVPIDGGTPTTPPSTGDTPGSPDGTTPPEATPGVNPPAGNNPPPARNVDYDQIRRLIREYEQRIEELKKQLPPSEH